MQAVISTQVCEGLDFLEKGDLTVHSSFRHAVNLKSDSAEGLFSIVSFDKPLVPNGAVAVCSELPFAEAGLGVEFKNGRLLFNEFAVDLSNAVQADLTVSPWVSSSKEVRRLAGMIEEVVGARQPGVEKIREMKRLDGGVSDVLSGLVGLGPGLTPSGDDFICGWLWAWRSCGDDRFDELAREAMKRIHETTDASANFIRLACSSRFAAALKIVQKHPLEGLKWMAEQGSSSGVDTLFGAKFGLENSRLLQ